MCCVPVTRKVPVTLMPNQYLLDEYTKISAYWISWSWTGCPPARKVPAQIHNLIKLDIATHSHFCLALQSYCVQMAYWLCHPFFFTMTYHLQAFSHILSHWIVIFQILVVRRCRCNMTELGLKPRCFKLSGLFLPKQIKLYSGPFYKDSLPRILRKLIHF